MEFYTERVMAEICYSILHEISFSPGTSETRSLALVALLGIAES